MKDTLPPTKLNLFSTETNMDTKANDNHQATLSYIKCPLKDTHNSANAPEARQRVVLNQNYDELIPFFRHCACCLQT